MPAPSCLSVIASGLACSCSLVFPSMHSCLLVLVPTCSCLFLPVAYFVIFLAFICLFVLVPPLLLFCCSFPELSFVSPLSHQVEWIRLRDHLVNWNDTKIMSIIPAQGWHTRSVAWRQLSSASSRSTSASSRSRFLFYSIKKVFSFLPDMVRFS